jgi:probable FeS assembly SUF system protein SufT
VNFTRDVDAVIVPAGVNVKLRQGQQGYITQALGGSFTVYVEGNLFRIAGKDADALGKEPAETPELPPNASDDDVKQVAWQQMKGCYDPEIPINIVDLGLVYECEVIPDGDGRVLSIKMTLTAPGCGMGRARRRRQERSDHPDRGSMPTSNSCSIAVGPVDDVEAARLLTGMM